MSRKDVTFAVYNGEPVDCFVHGRDTHIIMTPGERNMGGEEQPDGSVIGLDWFGSKWIAPKGFGPLMGATITEDGCPCDDAEDAIRFVPTAEQVRAFNWKGWADEVLQGYDPDEQILFCRSMTGFFERLHCLIGFENALCAFYEDPESVEALFAAILEYKKTVVDCVCDVMKPDIFCFDDDYGTANATFMSPDMWREFFPRYWKPLVDYVHEKGMKFELHSCGYITPLVGDFVELGMDSLQPVQTHNNLREIKEKYGDKIVLRLAIFDKQMDGMFENEEAVRTALREWYSILAPGGRFIPDVVPIDDPFYHVQRQFTYEFEKEFFGTNT